MTTEKRRPTEVTWEWQLDESLDTIVADSLANRSSSPDGAGTNPYDQAATNAPRDSAARRRTLDDMRLLSENIKRSKAAPSEDT